MKKGLSILLILSVNRHGIFKPLKIKKDKWNFLAPIGV